jgi:hypothetical protein
LPLVLVGSNSGLRGRHIAYPKDTPMTNLLLAMLERVGVEVAQYGDSTGRLELEPLAGL